MRIFLAAALLASVFATAASANELEDLKFQLWLDRQRAENRHDELMSRLEWESHDRRMDQMRHEDFLRQQEFERWLSEYRKETDRLYPVR